jgi:prephenate dehydrogenase
VSEPWATDHGAPPGTALIVGTGLIGASVGLALTRAGWQVNLQDPDMGALRLAADLGAGEPSPPVIPPSVVLVCTPPRVTPEVTKGLQGQYMQSTFSDVGSTKSQVLADIQNSGGDLGRFVGGHPLAGRERSGPAAAQADLFDGRPWVLTPTPQTQLSAVDDVRRLVEACGAVPVVISAEEHDRAVALTSHLPQLLASAMAAQLAGVDDATMSLAGQGLRDLTRIADSDPRLWEQIVSSNAAAVLAGLDSVVDDLDVVRDELLRRVASASGATRAGVDGNTETLERQVDMTPDLPLTRRLVERGRAGRARLPGKHGAARVDFSTVQVVIADRPGELARLLVACGQAGVNVEDVAIEHSPGHPVGLVELAVRPDSVSSLAGALTSGGWSVHT